MRQAMYASVFVLVLLVACQGLDTATQEEPPTRNLSAVQKVRDPYTDVLGPYFYFLKEWQLLHLDIGMLQADLLLRGQTTSLVSLQPFTKRLRALKAGVARTQAALSDAETSGMPIDASLERDLTTVRGQMPGVLAELEEIELRLNRLRERQAVDAPRIELKRQRYREHLLKGIADQAIPDKALYADDAVVIYAQAYAPSGETLCIQLSMGLIEPRPSEIELRERRGEEMSDSERKVAEELFGNGKIDFSLFGARSHSIFVYDHETRSVGSPTSVSLDKSDNVAVLQLTFEHSTSLDSSPLKVLIHKDTFYNAQEATLSVSDVTKQAPPVIGRIKKQADGRNAVPNFMSEIAVIACKRASNQLFVPVTLDIHGGIVHVELLMDTGASVTLIPMSVYAQGNARPITSLNTRSLETVAGPITAYFDEIEISTGAHSKKAAVAISDSEAQLLGVDYFEGTLFTIDMDNECIYLHPKSP